MGTELNFQIIFRLLCKANCSITKTKNNFKCCLVMMLLGNRLSAAMNRLSCFDILNMNVFFVVKCIGNVLLLMLFHVSVINFC